ncbi:hypothetical protein H8957_017591, partial [Semnopithecus entellus]
KSEILSQNKIKIKSPALRGLSRQRTKSPVTFWWMTFVDTLRPSQVTVPMDLQQPLGVTKVCSKTTSRTSQMGQEAVSTPTSKSGPFIGRGS